VQGVAGRAAAAGDDVTAAEAGRLAGGGGGRCPLGGVATSQHGSHLVPSSRTWVVVRSFFGVVDGELG